MQIWVKEGKIGENKNLELRIETAAWQFQWHYFSSVILSRHKQEADEIVRVAKAANDTSTEAYQLLLKTLAGENQTANDIDELNQKWVSNRKLFLFPGFRAVLKFKMPF